MVNVRCLACISLIRPQRILRTPLKFGGRISRHLVESAPWRASLVKAATLRQSLPILPSDTTPWPSSARFSAALAKGVYGLCHLSSPPPLAESPRPRQTFAYKALRPLESVVSAMKSITPIKVIPSGDRAVHHLCELQAHARRQGPFGYYAAETIEISLGLAGKLLDRYRPLHASTGRLRGRCSSGGHTHPQHA